MFFYATEQPFLWTPLWWAVCSLVAAAIQNASWSRAPLINFAAVSPVLAGYDGYLRLRTPVLPDTSFGIF